MYSSRENNAYSQQSYAGQSAYGQNLGSGYTGSSVGGPDGGSQLSIASRHSSVIGGSQETCGGGYRTHYGGQYSSVYASASQVPAITAKAGLSTLEGRTGYTSVITNSPKFSSGDYVSSSSHGYSHKTDQLYAEKVPDYPVIDRRQYGEHPSAYVGRDLHSEPTGRYTESVGFVSQHQAVLLRQDQLLKAQSLQSASLDASARQADYLAARGAASRHSTQELISLGGRADADTRGLSMLSASLYGGQHAPSILGAAPRRNVDDLMYAQSSSNPGYGVSLPPGRDYATGKGLHDPSHDSDYQGSMLPRADHSRIDEHKDDRASYLRDYEQREEERRHERLRERDRDREREKERERERERDRERDRERMLDRREKERERDRKRPLEIRRKRTPPRVSRDRRGSSLAKEGGRPLRRDSPRRESLHRRRSPVKEKRREYVCKVYTSSVVDVERGYLSIDKRYPRLFISPEFSKVFVNWSKENLKLSIHTPVSFEHDFVEEEDASELKKPSTELLSEESAKVKHENTVWNVKIILMSGISKNALEELSSEKRVNDRIPHICNILRFALLKRDHSYMAIGGPWNPVDGPDPSIDNSSLIQTAQRYAKDVVKLDLQNCQSWNSFLEIHYDRFGKDGLFSHKEITVVFVPDLSECLPSLNVWRDQWLAYKKAVAERDELSKKERPREEALKDKDDSSKDGKRVHKEGKKKEPTPTGKGKDVEREKDDKGLKGNVDGKDVTHEAKTEEKDGNEADKEAKNEKKEQEKTVGVPTPGSVKSGKKKIIRKIVKQKAVGKTTGDTIGKLLNEKDNGKKCELPNEKDNGEKNAESDPSAQQGDPSGVKTLTRKKVAKKVGTASENNNKDAQLETDAEKTDCPEDKPKDNSDPSVGGAAQDSSVKTTIKKKIIKRIPKKKATGTEFKNKPSNNKKVGDNSNSVREDGTENTWKQEADAENPMNDIQKTDKKMISQKKSLKTQAAKKEVIKTEVKDEIVEKKDTKSIADRSGSVTRENVDPGKQKAHQKDNHGKMKDDEKAKYEQERKGKDSKDESRNQSSKDKEKKPEEPPRHPGLIIQTKWSKDCKLRSSSLSLDSLLDYSDKDIDESTFELSLFAETLYEMLQYQMGYRILTFLQKLRISFVRKRSQRKRQHEEHKEAEKVKGLPSKRLKTEELPVKNQSSQSSESLNATQPDDENKEEKITAAEDQNLMENVDEEMEHGTDDEEGSEEDPEEYEEMEDASPQQNDESAIEQSETKALEAETNHDVNTQVNKEVKMDTIKKESAKEAINDKELLQAFRFFDRNRVGYIRVEDMRLIIHNLGKYLSHRDVKDLVQSALLESNTGRDDRILYLKLVKMTDI